MTPGDFWRLYPTEFWWLVDARRPKKMYGSLSEQDLDSMMEDLEQMEGWND